MHLTQGGSVQRLLTNGPRGWPTGQILSRFGPRLPRHESTQEEKGQGKRRCSTRPASHVARPANHHMVSYCLGQVGGAPSQPYKYPSQ
jgi:hypothetical protein